MIKFARSVQHLGYRSVPAPGVERAVVGLSKVASRFARVAVDLRGHFYIDTWAVSGYERFGLNENDDGFETLQLKQAHRTFVGSWACFDHENDHPDLAVGTNVDSVYMPDDYVRVAMAIDRERAEARRPGIEARIDRGEVTDTSMGVFASESLCTIPTCANLARDEDEFCEHVIPRKEGGLRGVTLNDRRTNWEPIRCGELNRGLYFFENTIITVDEGADPNAKIQAKLASSRRKRDEISALLRAAREIAVDAGPQGMAVLARLVHRVRELVAE